MFDLEEQIAKWRRTAADALGNRPEVIDELESHLRDDVQRLVQSGQSAEAAWETAVTRLGATKQLAAEFAKVPPTPAFWLPARRIPIGVFALSTGLGTLIAVSDLECTYPIGLLLVSHIFAMAAGCVTIFAIGALAAWSILTRAISGWDALQANAVRSSDWKLTLAGLILTVIGFLLGGLWAHDNLGRFWDWDQREVGELSVMAWYCLMLLCLRFCRVGGSAEMVIGVAGSVVACMSMFGASMLTVGAILMQLAILGIAMVPPGRLGRRRALTK
jgi:hypothetical protein